MPEVAPVTMQSLPERAPFAVAALVNTLGYFPGLGTCWSNRIGFPSGSVSMK